MRKTALITGGSRGIGFGIAEKLAAEGYNLVLSGRRPAEEVEDSIRHLRAIGSSVRYCVSDISNARDRSALIARTRECFGRLDALVNNAGVAPEFRVDILNTSEESFNQVLKVNLRGPFFLTQAVSEWMLKQRSDSSEYNGVIINIGSISADVVSLNRAEYCISKAGVGMMTRLFAARLSGYGISVFEIRPGIIKTDMTNAAEEKYSKLLQESDLCVIKRWGLPEDIGRVAAALATGKMPYCVGQVITVDGGLTLPRL